MTETSTTSTYPAHLADATGQRMSDAPNSTTASALLQMIWGIHISRCVYAVAELGIADLLHDAPLSAAELARATGTQESLLYRVLRLLAALGVFEEHASRRFGLTAVGDRLRSDAPGAMRSWATFIEALGGVRPFAHIIETIRTGTPGREIEFGMELFEFISQNPEQAATFNAAMSERTAAYAPSVARTYDFSEIRTVVDVGGGQGILLAEILKTHRHLNGLLFEIPAVASDATAIFNAVEITDRCKVLGGDFFAGVPAGADCYLLANVLHDWNDERAIEILTNCRRSIAKGGRVLIVERLISDDPAESVPTLLSDINMLVLTGGCERTNAEYGSLLRRGGLRRRRVLEVAYPYGIIEGVGTSDST